MQRGAPAVAALAAVLAGGAAPPAEPQDSARLTAFLARMQRVAALYRDLALKFECTETIQYRVSGSEWKPPTGYVKLSYLYERDAHGQLKDCRMWPKSITNAGNLRCVAPSEYKVPLYLNNAYSWIFAFLEQRQQWQDFRIAGEETALGRPAVVVEFAPRGVIRPQINDWYGRAWIDRDTYQFLAVEAYLPDDWQAKLGLERERERLESSAPQREGPDFEVQAVVTEFGEVRNGMRFASRVVMRRLEYRWSSGYKEKELVRVEQKYSKYRFYDVATSEAIERIVNAPSQTP
jgi:hypothetical protein